jgi:hypothetical protein
MVPASPSPAHEDTENMTHIWRLLPHMRMLEKRASACASETGLPNQHWCTIVGLVSSPVAVFAEVITPTFELALANIVERPWNAERLLTHITLLGTLIQTMVLATIFRATAPQVMLAWPASSLIRTGCSMAP